MERAREEGGGGEAAGSRGGGVGGRGGQQWAGGRRAVYGICGMEWAQGRCGREQGAVVVAAAGCSGGLALSERHEHDVQTTLDTPPGSLAAGCVAASSALTPAGASQRLRQPTLQIASSQLAPPPSSGCPPRAARDSVLATRADWPPLKSHIALPSSALRLHS